MALVEIVQDLSHLSQQRVELFQPELLRRFDVNGPRYTSYPTADRFSSDFGSTQYQHALHRLGQQTRPLSLYFHIPFCPNICYYCGCNKIITKDHARSEKYIKYLSKEIQLVTGELRVRERIPVTQLHWGGGTPTFLSHHEMRELMGVIHQHFDLHPDGEYSIEIDPRRVQEGDIRLLAELGFNRISLGVQDFDHQVQQAIHRIQTIEETYSVLKWARQYGFLSISMDLIYGLPKQTSITFKETVDEVLKMSPDRLSVYSYAHLPHVFKPQRRISTDDLPGPEEKLKILSNTIAQLNLAGYAFIGMDHFAKPEDELAVAQREGRLHRNFQGYSTQAECDLLAFGVSSIGKVMNTYAQNVRTADEYYDLLDQNILPIFRGIELSMDDIIRRSLITELMCQFEINTQVFGNSFDIDFVSYFHDELEEIKNLISTGIVAWDGATLYVPTKGRLLVRRVAMIFDRYLKQSQADQRYSKIL